MKSLKDISWQVTEPEYRADKALSYSTLSSYERGGRFESLPTLFDRKESPSLLLGSCVDTLITGSREEFDSLYFVGDFDCPDSVQTVVKALFEAFKDTYDSLESIPNTLVTGISDQLKYQLNWKPETRAKVLKEKGADYYNLLFLSKDKKLVSSEMYADALRMEEALRTAKSTSYLFALNNPFDESIQRFYQLKFKGNIDGIDFRFMADEIIVLHEKKLILPIDLKTSGKPEYNFYKSFLEWRYDLQAKLYSAILEQNIKKDDYFKDFTILPYIFAVVNKKTLTPLCWEYEDNLKYREDFVVDGVTYRNPISIAKELTEYLKNPVSVPTGISLTSPNNLLKWINNGN